MINYFLTYRPFHVTYVTEITTTKLFDDDNRIINHFSEPVELSSLSCFSRVLNVPVSFFARRAAFRTIIQEWQQELSTGKAIQIFIPHTLGMLSNFAFFRLAKAYPNLRINIYYEGVILFYSYHHDYLRNLKYYTTRYISGLISGIPYTIQKQLLNLYDERVTKVYSPFIEIPVQPEKIVKVDLKKVQFEPQATTCILLGLDLGKGFDADSRKIVNAIFDRLQAEDIQLVYMKDHPSEKSKYFYEVAEERGIAMKPIKDKAPIETIIGNYQPGWVFSIWSSAMINLTSVAPKELNLVVYVTKHAVTTIGTTSLMQIFEKVGVEVNYVH